MAQQNLKYIFVSGGVISGLGKGITAASLALLLKSRGIQVSPMKADMYLNVDAGTMNPVEHGEVFVTCDGVETDQDLGHYERFLHQELYRENYVTNGQIYREVLENERSFEYGGKTVQPYHHIPPIIEKRLQQAAQKHNSDVVICELGGTVGEYEGLLFFETIRRLQQRHPQDVAVVHVGYLPAPASIGELKSKPLQMSVSQLNSLGIHPDIIVARAEKPIDKKRKDKIALASGLGHDEIIANPDVNSIYQVPLLLEDQNLDEKIIQKLHLKTQKRDLRDWRRLNQRIKNAQRKLPIGIIGKYQKTGNYTLEDSYICVVEALRHAAWERGLQPDIKWVDAEKLETLKSNQLKERFADLAGMIVPQGWGSRGVEGKLRAVRHARENKLPLLGLCFGMQMMVIEYARNMLGLKDANSEEADPDTLHPVIHIMPDQKEYLRKNQYGGTIRLGHWTCQLKPSTILADAYGGAERVKERHRHRYELNNSYRDKLEGGGLVISGTSPDGRLVEAVELPREIHPFFVGTQFHPEYQSWPLKPHPLFQKFIQAATEQ